ncbi:TPR end-of-group domain-containing protein [Microcoleus sp. Aus8_D2]|uniref:TPR end-of-group domain-containing protein n=1 Tax=unclassified Microcoleus TaxID=2642155 RepID=UPI003FA5E4ED
MEDARSSYHKALEFKPDYHDAFYNKACSYALHSQVDSSIQNLQRAINLDPDEYREMATTDSDFDGVRSHPQFQALIE